MGGSELHPYVEVCKGRIEECIQASALGRKRERNNFGVSSTWENRDGVWPMGTGDVSQLDL